MSPAVVHRRSLHMFLGVIVAVALLFALVIVPRTPDTTLLEQVKREGKLVVATRNSATTYYEGPDGPTGFEYDLVSAFADDLGVEIELVIPSELSEILPLVGRGEAHLAAAGLTKTDARERLVRFGPVYQEITQQVVYRKGQRRPRQVKDLAGGLLEVISGTTHVETLQRVAREHPDLSWREHSNAETEELLELVQEELIDFTIADSNEVALTRRFYPELRVAFDLTEPEPLAWAFRRDADQTLLKAAQEFFTRIDRDGTLQQIRERHYGHVERFDYQGIQTLLRHRAERLTEYERWFRDAGRIYHVDWRLLAAMGYQESHWNEDAVSPTGVRGVMMLTQRTARHLGIEDRTDARASIYGGARWFSSIKARLPDRIREPDRTWLAMAAYNVGLGHVYDARKITERLDGDPDKWVDLKKALPLLSKKKWYQDTKHGYARGWEPVHYVENIRGYYEILVWITERERRGESPESVNNELFSILPPVL